MKNNYDKVMLDTVSKFDGKKSILLHSCCGPCSSACIERLKDYFNITVLYYNPNIEPKEEYEHRKSEQKRLLEAWNIDFMECDYDNETFRCHIKGLENEPEGGSRCSICFSLRLNYTAKCAKENNFDYFGTTLTVSPHKNSEVINKLGIRIGSSVGVNYLCADFKKREGYKRSIELAKEYELYRQDYCGCQYSRRDENEEK